MCTDILILKTVISVTKDTSYNLSVNCFVCSNVYQVYCNVDLLYSRVNTYVIIKIIVQIMNRETNRHLNLIFSILMMYKYHYYCHN